MVFQGPLFSYNNDVVHARTVIFYRMSFIKATVWSGNFYTCMIQFELLVMGISSWSLWSKLYDCLHNLILIFTPMFILSAMAVLAGMTDCMEMSQYGTGATDYHSVLLAVIIGTMHN